MALTVLLEQYGDFWKFTPKNFLIMAGKFIKTGKSFNLNAYGKRLKNPPRSVYPARGASRGVLTVLMSFSTTAPILTKETMSKPPGSAPGMGRRAAEERKMIQVKLTSTIMMLKWFFIPAVIFVLLFQGKLDNIAGVQELSPYM